MKEISPVGTKIGEVYFPPKNGENGDRVAFVWEGDVFRFATKQEILTALQTELEKQPLVNKLSRRQLRKIKT